MKQIILFILIIATISGCSSGSSGFRKSADFLQIRKNMNKEEVRAILENYEFARFKNDTTVQIDYFDISNDVNTGFKTEIFLINKLEYFNRYFIFAFVDGKLVYWGKPEEFNKASNDLYYKIGIAATKIVTDSYYIIVEDDY